MASSQADITSTSTASVSQIEPNSSSFSTTYEGYAVQLGVFEDVKAAEQIQEKLNEQAVSVFLWNSNGQTYLIHRLAASELAGKKLAAQLPNIETYVKPFRVELPETNVANTTLAVQQALDAEQTLAEVRAVVSESMQGSDKTAWHDQLLEANSRSEIENLTTKKLLELSAE
ncbi:hypothetical protein G4V62_11180 [Bacillaceae bacterium SIJ1]|uniref:hypothetical protein n=1 Tax=Litoribacterium kuwaitense TaxID=1398745 RepID=UPI0013EBBEE9|nr:hypothetical protein [Litoribacterium kuwaitense]NGP45491.1 hypothetical protein [Litoribacterium kuwaitense]